LPIKFFYFEDFRWPFFGKITGQKRLMFQVKITRKNATLLLMRNYCYSERVKQCDAIYSLDTVLKQKKKDYFLR
jgi:hypothetical protein